MNPCYHAYHCFVSSPGALGQYLGTSGGTLLLVRYTCAQGGTAAFCFSTFFSTSLLQDDALAACNMLHGCTTLQLLQRVVAMLDRPYRGNTGMVCPTVLSVSDAAEHACRTCSHISAIHPSLPRVPADVQEALGDKDAGVVVCCQMGGTLEPKEGSSSLGVQSRSLVAAYQLVKAGYTGIRVLNNGMNAWEEDGYDMFMYEE